MKQAMINWKPEWTFWLPDSVADWDAIQHWERERLASMQRHLKPGDVLYDIGTEHGWLTAVYGGFCGHENVVLIEPSPEFWPNIKGVWTHNGFPGPLGAYAAFCGPELNGEPVSEVWPPSAEGPEVGGMAYRYLGNPYDIPTVTVDHIAVTLRPPNALTIDVEGAELLVLHGAAMVLSKFRPLVWVSLHPDLMERDFPGQTADLLFEYMSDHDYTAQFIHKDHEQHWLFKPEAR